MNKQFCSLSILVLFTLVLSGFCLNDKVYQTATKGFFEWQACIMLKFPNMPQCDEIKDDNSALITCYNTYFAFLYYYGFPSFQQITPECKAFQNDLEGTILYNNFATTYPDCLNSIMDKIKSLFPYSPFFYDNILPIFLECGGVSAEETKQINNQI
ncbi:transmembrane protein, putative (macronuclear) [Tetrahymena thermophila SB210]|uniref:Transmembrane protein, putative n=1 Tax=Tetrahymena thermophila (strain SB210) TaxID=312017 RepID=Q241X5_TETTS|nr:transmembrane protein, putative [Tetrahymena thermophila SB210]EAS02576.2 transmembrane protein, putative [Tetrahymena thermophila SB210]|eukprot:XP_001022821.2 transmembrane protein, putative [Tetrahymena thermophila SB210]